MIKSMNYFKKHLNPSITFVSLVRIGLFCIFFLMTGCVPQILGFKKYKGDSIPCPKINKTEAIRNPTLRPRLGFSDYGRNDSEFILAEQLKVDLLRIDFPWREVIPNLNEEDLIDLESLKSDPKKVEQLIKKISEEKKWKSFDKKIDQAIKRNIEIIPIVGHGYKFYQPLYKGKPFGPHLVGQQKYLGTMALFVRAFVRHYSHQFKIYQIENELNVAALTQLWGWREPSDFEAVKKGDWANLNFQKKVMETLLWSVKTEDPDGLVTHNFQTDLSGKLQNQIGQPTWEQSIELWRNYLDIIGLDYYPNYYDSDKKVEGELSRIIETARVHGCGKPVWIIETNYPSGPKDLGYTPEKQANFIKMVKKEAEASRAEVLLFYGALSTSYVEDRETFANQKKVMLRKFIKEYEKGSLSKILLMLLKYRKSFQSGELTYILTSVEPFWDFYDEFDNPKPAVDTFLNFKEK